MHLSWRRTGQYSYYLLYSCLPRKPPGPAPTHLQPRNPRHVQRRCRAARGRLAQPCPRRGQPQERRQVARPENPGRQGALGAERAQARVSCCRTRMPPRSRRSRRRSWRSLRRRGRCSPRSPSAWSPRPGGSSGPSAWPPERGWGPVPQPGGQGGRAFCAPDAEPVRRSRQRSWSRLDP
jgi:hypothetical protein